MIDTKSVFNFGHEVTTSNNELCFDEGSGEIIAELTPGNYSLAEFAFEIERAMRDAGTLDYSVSVTRTANANTVTISAGSAFDLLVSTGSTLVSVFTLAGFTGGNRTGASSYTGNAKSGKQYYPQFLIQSYAGSEHLQESFDYTLNRTPSGRVELVRFGVDKFVEAELKFITNLPMDGIVIESNPTGVEDAVEFLKYITQKGRFEFVADRSTPATYQRVILESLPGYSDGTGYRLREMINENLRDIYDVGLMKMRVLE